MLLFDKAPAEDAIETLLTQLEFGLPANLLALLELPVELSRGEYLILGGRGFSTVEAIQTADLNLLKELVGEEKSESLRKV